MPSAGDRPDLRVVHVGVDEPGKHAASRRGRRPPRRDDRSRSAAKAPRATITPSRDQEPAVALGAQGAAGERVVGGVQDRRRGRASWPEVPTTRRVLGPRMRRLGVEHPQRAAATLTAMVAGSLPVSSGSPIGVVIRSTASGAWPSSASLRRNRAHFAGRADQPDRAEVGTAERGVAQRGVLGVVVGHDQDVRAGRQLAEDQLGQDRHLVHVHPRDGVVEHAEPCRRRAARRASRPGAGRGRAGPGSGPAPARRGRRRRSRRPVRRAAARAAG